MTKISDPSQFPDHGPNKPTSSATVHSDPAAPADLATRPELTHLNPWERSIRESDRDWALFVQYRDSAYPNGPFGVGRAKRPMLRELAGMYNLKPDSLYQVSKNFAWEWRCAHFDRHIDRERLENGKATLLQRTKEAHEKLLAKTHEVVELELAKLLQRAQDPQAPALTARELKSLLEFLLENQRLLAGQATSHVAVQVNQTVDLRKLDLAELQALKNATEKAGMQVLPIEATKH